MGTVPTTPAPVIAVVGPSGVGKDTVMSALCAANPALEKVRRVITRSVEAGGEDFTAATVEEFAAMDEAGAFALRWQAHGLNYGIPVEIDAQRSRARGVLVNLSRSVLMQAQNRFGDLIVVSLSAAPDVLASRLQSRGRERPEAQADRLRRAALALPDGLSIVHQIDNSGSLGETVQAVVSLLAPESV